MTSKMPLARIRAHEPELDPARRPISRDGVRVARDRDQLQRLDRQVR
jgi:hypothetical protein